MNERCSPTLESNICGILINHTFADPGSYCLNVTVENQVSSAHTIVTVKIPSGKFKDKAKKGLNLFILSTCLAIGYYTMRCDSQPKIFLKFVKSKTV